MKELEEIKPFLLSVPGVDKVAHIKFDEYGFSRTIEFTAMGKMYTIEWWNNVYYLKFDSFLMPFDEFRNLYTWPTFFKDQLQFYKGGEIVAVIGTTKRENNA